MNAMITSRLLAIGSEDTILLSLAAVVLLYFVTQSPISTPKHEKSRLKELFSIPQEKMHPAGIPANSQRRSRNICDAIKSPAGVEAVVFWASQSGTAEVLASRYASELSTVLSLRTVIANLADYDHSHMPDVPSQALLVFILSTFGDGDPPDNGVALLDALRLLCEQGRNLMNIRYVMFGLGNSNYSHFNKYAIDVDSVLVKMGATRLSPLGLGDDRSGATGEDFLAWKHETTQQVAKALNLRVVKRVYSPRICIRPLQPGVSRTIRVYHGEPAYAAATEEMSGNLTVPITQARKLAPHTPILEANAAPRECIHLEFSLDSYPSVTYETGDYLCIWPINPEHEVSALLQVLGVWNIRKDVIDIVPEDGALSSGIRIPTPATLESLFRYCLDICGPVSRELLNDIAEFAKDSDAKSRLQVLANDRDAFHKQVTSKKLTLAAVLQMVTMQGADNGSAIDIPVTYILENLKKLQPRSYSISSSAAVEPRTVSITALAVADDSDKISRSPQRFRGLASNYLLQLQQEFCSGTPEPQPTNCYSTAGPRGLLQGGKIFARIRRSTFRLPPGPSTPIIMIGSGTGIAPFRAFVQERMMLKRKGIAVGKTVLLVGHRAPDQDYYYQDLWEEAQKTLGDLFEVYTAFSRVEKQPRQYVQDLLATKSDLVIDILGGSEPESGVLYICGSSLMASGVKKCLAQIWSQSSRRASGPAGVTAETWLGDLARMRRLQEDSWG